MLRELNIPTDSNRLDQRTNHRTRKRSAQRLSRLSNDGNNRNRLVKDSKCLPPSDNSRILPQQSCRGDDDFQQSAPNPLHSTKYSTTQHNTLLQILVFYNGQESPCAMLGSPIELRSQPPPKKNGKHTTQSEERVTEEKETPSNNPQSYVSFSCGARQGVVLPLLKFRQLDVADRESCSLRGPST